jgi:hypothetical protein
MNSCRFAEIHTVYHLRTNSTQLNPAQSSSSQLNPAQANSAQLKLAQRGQEDEDSCTSYI